MVHVRHPQPLAPNQPYGHIAVPSVCALACVCFGLLCPSTQVKAFRFMGCAPRRPFRLTARAKDNARRRLQGENPGAGSAAAARGRSSSSSSTAGGRKPAKSRSMFALPVGGRGTGSSRTGGPGGDGDGGAGMEALEDRSCSGLGLGVELSGAREGGLGGLRGDWEAAEEAAVAAAACGEGRHGGGGGSGGDGRQAERKKLACGMCGAMRIPEDVSFRMTAKMVRETVFHVSGHGHGVECGPSVQSRGQH